MAYFATRIWIDREYYFTLSLKKKKSFKYSPKQLQEAWTQSGRANFVPKSPIEVLIAKRSFREQIPSILAGLEIETEKKGRIGAGDGRKRDKEQCLIHQEMWP